MKDLKVVSFYNEGEFSSFFQVKNEQNQHFALKIYKNINFENNLSSIFKRKFGILKKIIHQNLITFYDYKFDEREKSLK